MSKKTTKTPRKRKRKMLQIVDRAYLAMNSRPAWGMCYRKKHLIEILGSLKSFDYLDTMIHELLHYYFPKESENCVNKTATLMATALWGRRYRRLSK